MSIGMIFSGLLNARQNKEITNLENQVEYLQEGYEDMDRSLDCVIAFKGELKTNDRAKGCLLPNGSWEAPN